MVKTLCCTDGHQWQIMDDVLSHSELREQACPICGAQAETVVDGSRLHDTSKDHHPAASPSNDPHRLTGYEILEEAGRGGMGVVYRAFDSQHNRIVALKTLQRIDSLALQRFKKEFRLLSDIAHPNLVSLYELISDGETWCFTMELIDGVDLLRYIRYGPPGENTLAAAVTDVTIELDPAAVQQAGQPGLSPVQLNRLRSAVGQLASGIAMLHAAGILHRDIKPSNVLVTKEGRTVLLDFGLAAELDSKEMHHHSQVNILGTVAYMSPEQAACDTVTPAADWYSLGSLLYEALTGQTPFVGNSLQLLQAKQNEDPLPPSTVWPDVPHDLEQLCLSLLQRDPTQRPAGSEVLRVLEQNELLIDSRRSSADEADHLIGREKHLAALRQAYAEVKNGRAVNVFVRGASGNGKSALLQHFLDEIRNDYGSVVLAGRCYERESVPFKAIDGLVDSLVARLKSLSRAAVEAVLPRDVQALARLFPALGQLEAVADQPQRKIDISDQQELNRRAIAALRELLARMGDRIRLVVYIDDLQWGDEDSAAMVSDLLQPPDPPVMLFLGTYRSEDAETSLFLHSFRQIQLQREMPLESLQIEVDSLDPADTVRLALALLERDDTDARRSAETIAREAAGNPFFVSELVKQLQLDGESISDAASEPLVLADMIWSRVQRLPDDAQRLLEFVALWGQPLPLDQAMQIANVEHSAVGPLRAGHLIRTAGSPSSSIIETYHDRVRESVVARLDRATSAQHHLRIAEDYARQTPLDGNEIMARLGDYFTAGLSNMDSQLEVLNAWYDIAFHYDAAGRSDLAFPYALATAERARTQFSLEVSERQYRIAERGVEGQDDAVRYGLAEGLGDVLMLRGKYPEAAKQFKMARTRLSGTNAESRIEGKLGELAFKQGDNKAGIEAVERSLRLLGRRVPSTTLGFLPLLVWEVLVQSLHTMFPKRFLARRSLQQLTQDEVLAINLHVHLARAYFFERGKIPCLWTHLRSINLVERYPPTRELGYAWASHAPVLSLIPWLHRGEIFANKSLEIRKELGDVCGQGQSLHYLGVVHFAGARFDECISACREAVGLLERTGDFWERNMAWWQIANSIYRKGDLNLAITEARRLYEACSEMGDDKVAGFALDVWSRASGGRLPADILLREVEKKRNDVWATAQVLLAEAVRRVGQNELDEAVKILQQGYEVCRKGGMNAWVSPVLPWLATVRRMQLQKATDETRRRQLLKNARRSARQALAVARKFQTDLPHALRECGWIAALQGNLRKARKCLEESLAIAEKQGARLEHAQSLLARGQLGQLHDWPGAQQDLTSARHALHTLGADFLLDNAAAESLERSDSEVV